MPASRCLVLHLCAWVGDVKNEDLYSHDADRRHAEMRLYRQQLGMLLRLQWNCLVARDALRLAALHVT